MHAVIDQPAEKANDLYAKARAAQTSWGLKPIAERVRFVRELRRLMAEHADTLAAAAATVWDRPLSEKLVSELLPLIDACRWLEKSAARVLAPRRCGKRGRPLWMRRVLFEVQRQPFGLVLVIGPGNYPLFLPAVHSLHALVAGNAVLLKPAPGTRNVAFLVVRLVREAGLDPALMTVLDESVAAAHDAMSRGVDKVIFTGSSANGRDLLADLAKTNTPSVMELSSEDAVIVFADADLDLVVRALNFGARLNNGGTCIAPRRLIVEKSIAAELHSKLACAGIAPLPLKIFEHERRALDQIHSRNFALGASIFSHNVPRARIFAGRIRTGFVLINDLIVPTADPRMPFTGVKASGFGSTRGDEGLLEMTFPHVVATRYGNSHRHFDQPGIEDVRLFLSYIRAAHGRGRDRFGAIRDFIGALVNKYRPKK
jgi:acyl-CoA reductase-like NAD-dependent aldehyde dehydrogenase